MQFFPVRQMLALPLTGTSTWTGVWKRNYRPTCLIRVLTRVIPAQPALDFFIASATNNNSTPAARRMILPVVMRQFR